MGITINMLLYTETTSKLVKSWVVYQSSCVVVQSSSEFIKSESSSINNLIREVLSVMGVSAKPVLTVSLSTSKHQH